MRIKGEGPIPCGVMGVGEGPGIVESQYGRPFVGPAGGELNRYLNGYALPLRDDIYLTNLFKEWEGGVPVKKKITQADYDLSEGELHQELQAVQPQVVFSMGAYSTKWFLGPTAMATISTDMETIHGLLFKIAYCTYCGDRWVTVQNHPLCNCGGFAHSVITFWLVPVTHPAAGLHQPAMAASTAYDMAQLSLVLKASNWDREVMMWRMAPAGEYKELGPGANFIHGIMAEIGLDTEGSVAKPWGFSVSAKPGQGYVKRYDGTPIHLLPQTRWVLHNYMHDAKVIKAMGGEIPEDNFDDTQVMAYLLGIEPQALKNLSARHLGVIRPDFMDIFSEKVPLYGKPGPDKLKIHKKTGELEIIPGKPGKLLKKTKTLIHSMDAIYQKSPQTVIDYAGADAGDTIGVKQALWPRIQNLGLEAIYEIDRKVLPLYSRMEEVGIPVNEAYYKEFGQWLADEIEVKTMLLQAEWPSFNPASPDQVAEIMFGHLKLPGGKKTPTGARFSTNDKIMEALKDHPFVAAMIEWRELAKLKNTFIDPLPKFVRDGRLFCQLLPTRVVSGRLAAKDPNALAFPKYTELGIRFRGGVQAPPGRLLGSWDLNQIELRVLALDSGSEVLKHAFLTGADLHTRTARRVFGLGPTAKEGKAQRVAAKAVNFGIPMGLTEVGLAEQMRKHHYPFPELQGQVFATTDDLRKAQAEVCGAWIKATIDDWGIADFISMKHAEARRYGYVTSRGGRIRFCPGVLSPNKKVKEAAMRDAQAYAPQAGARYFMKQVEYRVWSEVIKPFTRQGAYIEPILDIHDDLLLEFQDDLGDLLLGLIESMVADSFNTEIPITAKGAVGTKWNDI